MEILSVPQYAEYDSFILAQESGCFLQSTQWAKVKQNWKHEIVVSRDTNGKINGGMSILIKHTPIGSFMYAPRGPVCHAYTTEILQNLLAGAKQLSKTYKAFSLIIDPFIKEDDAKSIHILTSLGARYKPHSTLQESIQPRHNYILDNIKNTTTEELLASFNKKTRYYTRFASKSGVSCAFGLEHLTAFYSLYVETGKRQGFPIRSLSYMQNILEHMGNYARVYVCYSADGKPICGALAINYAEKTEYLYGGSTAAPELRKLHASYYLQWQIMQWALETSCSVYNMQGVSICPEESLPLYNVLAFKQHFPGKIYSFAGDFTFVYRPILHKAISTAMKARTFLIRQFS